MKTTDKMTLYVNVQRREPMLQRKSFALIGADVSTIKTDDGLDIVALYLTEAGARALIDKLQDSLSRMDDDREFLKVKQEA